MPTSAQRIATVFQKIFGVFVDVKWSGVGIAPLRKKSEAGRFLEAALEQLIEFLGAVALVERDFPQRAGSGSGERCVCCFSDFAELRSAPLPRDGRNSLDGAKL